MNSITQYAMRMYQPPFAAYQKRVGNKTEHPGLEVYYIGKYLGQVACRRASLLEARHCGGDLFQIIASTT